MQTQFHLLAHVMSQMRRVHAGFLSDTRRCPMVTSDSVCRTTMPDSGWRPFTWYRLRRHRHAEYHRNIAQNLQ